MVLSLSASVLRTWRENHLELGENDHLESGENTLRVGREW